MRIPLVDLVRQFELLREEIEPAVAKVLASAQYIGGPEVAAFEREFAAYCGAAACASCGNGTDALYLALRALGVGSGDEVVTVSHTFVATAEAIALTGAKPVFVDVLPETMLMSPEACARAVTSRTRAIVAVHLYGQTCEMESLSAVARRAGIPLVEDAAQAHGAEWRGRRAGTLGRVAAFSFFPGKNLGAYGDAGAVVGDDAELVERVRQLANHGRRSKYLHEVEGVNSRLDAVQAAILRIKLRHLEAWNDARRQWANHYAEELRDLPVTLPSVAEGALPVWHLYVIRAAGRDGLVRCLAEAGIAAGVHYPTPAHLQPALLHLGYREGDLPVTEAICSEALSLPMYPELGVDGVAAVCSSLRDCLRGGDAPAGSGDRGGARGGS